jgi:hypothetical protein
MKLIPKLNHVDKSFINLIETWLESAKNGQVQEFFAFCIKSDGTTDKIYSHGNNSSLFKIIGCLEIVKNEIIAEHVKDENNVDMLK